MIRYITFVCSLLLFVSSDLFAQQDVLDSLVNVAKSTSNLKEKATLYSDIAVGYGATDINKSIHYAHRSVEVARKGKHKKEECRAYIILTTSYLRSGHIDSAAISSKECLALAEELNDYYYIFFAEANLS